MVGKFLPVLDFRPYASAKGLDAVEYGLKNGILNGYCESCNARFRDELLNGEVLYSLKEAQIIIEQWP